MQGEFLSLKTAEKLVNQDKEIFELRLLLDTALKENRRLNRILKTIERDIKKYNDKGYQGFWLINEKLRKEKIK